MNNAAKVVWILFTILIFLIGIWPLGLISIIIGIMQWKKSRERTQKNEKEIEIYKTAAEVEHTLNRERDSENEIYYR